MATIILEHLPSRGAGLLGDVLREFGHTLKHVRVCDGHSLPVDLDHVTGIVSLGGPQTSMDDEANPWMKQERSLLLEAHRRGVPILGICLGSQLLAQALGGRVERMPGLTQMGYHPIDLTPAGREDPLLAGIGWTSLQFEFHQDHVVELPAEAQLLATNVESHIQAWVAGTSSYGFQFHPEFDWQLIEEAADRSDREFKEAGITKARFLEQLKPQYPEARRLARRIFESVALCLMPVDRASSGLVRDLHH